ncbi:hypothetical protein [Paenibacillus sp. DMB5]|uniref:hypothetical protein n=1 Tax=Paenibacillus sp. DMB5 TaxID=1780103 RepID=UPI00083957F1|nr:hypothetical protein [Paenibacillus sp. DMB5]
MNLVTAEEMRQLDRMTIDKLGIPAIALMENAGRAIAEEVIALCRRKQNSSGNSWCGEIELGSDWSTDSDIVRSRSGSGSSKIASSGGCVTGGTGHSINGGWNAGSGGKGDGGIGLGWNGGGENGWCGGAQPPQEFRVSATGR